MEFNRAVDYIHDNVFDDLDQTDLEKLDYYIQHGNVPGIMSLLTHEDLNENEHPIDIVLCFLCQYSTVDAVKEYIEAVSELTDEINFESAFNSACRFGNMAIVGYLWSLCQDFDIGDAACAACAGGHLNVLTFLFKQQPDDSDFHDIMPSACEGGNVEVLLCLESRGFPYVPGCMPAACSSNNLNMVRYVADKVGDIPGEYNNGLLVACQVGDLDIIDHMLYMGANDYNGGLLCASSGGNVGAIKKMIELGANDYIGATTDACTQGKLNAVVCLVETGNIPIADLDLCLVAASMFSNTRIQKYLTLRGAFNSALRSSNDFFVYNVWFQHADRVEPHEKERLDTLLLGYPVFALLCCSIVNTHQPGIWPYHFEYKLLAQVSEFV